MEIDATIMMLMHQKSITPNVVTYSTMIDKYANWLSFEDAKLL
jgi:hypothetical protein